MKFNFEDPRGRGPVSGEIADQDRRAEEKLNRIKQEVDNKPKPEGVLGVMRHPIQALDRKVAESDLEAATASFEKFRESVASYMDQIQGEANEVLESLKQYESTQSQLEASIGAPALPGSSDAIVGNMYRYYHRKPEEVAKLIAVMDYLAPQVGRKEGARVPNTSFGSVPASEVEFKGKKYYMESHKRLPRMDLGTDRIEQAISEATGQGKKILIMTQAENGGKMVEDKWVPTPVTEKYVLLDSSAETLIKPAIAELKAFSREAELFVPGERREAKTLYFDSRILTPDELKKESEPISIVLCYDQVDKETKVGIRDSKPVQGERREVQKQVRDMASWGNMTNLSVEINGQKLPWYDFVEGKEAVTA